MLTTRINEHGETVTVIGTIANCKGGREEVTITEFGPANDRVFSLRGCTSSDARRFSTQVKRAKTRLSHPSMKAEWYC